MRSLLFNVCYSVLVVGDFQVVCDAIAARVEKSNQVSKVYTAPDTPSALEIIKNNPVDVAFINVSLPHAYGISLIHTLQNKWVSIKIIGIARFKEKETIVALIRSNAQGILLEHNIRQQELDHCLKEVMVGRNYFAEEVEEVHEQLFKKSPKPENSSIIFTNREFEMLQLLYHGQVTKQIAVILNLKETTIEDYRNTMLKKTGTKDTAELVAFAFKSGFL